MLHTGVSSDGTTLNIRALPGVSVRDTVVAALLAALKSGAWSPGFSCGPTRGIGLPLNGTAVARFCICVSSVVLGRRPRALYRDGRKANGRPSVGFQLT